jgi:hypothetical protein
MYNIKAIASILVQLPLTDKAGDKQRAGPPFQMPYTLAISMDPMDRWRQHSDLLRGALDLSCRALEPELNGWIKSNRNPSADPEFLRSNLEFLQALRELDRTSHDWVAKVIAGFAREEIPLP